MITRAHKAIQRSTYKHDPSGNWALGVTSGATVTGLESPFKRYGALKPWIAFANAAANHRPLENERPRELIETVEHERGTPHFPRKLILALAHDLDEPQAGWRALNALAVRVFTVLHGIAASGSKTHLRIYETASKYGLTVENAKVRVEPMAPFAAFAQALEGTEAARIRECPICNRLFYAVRRTRKACTQRCNQALRVRRHRAKQGHYELARKFKAAGIKPEGR